MVCAVTIPLHILYRGVTRLDGAIGVARGAEGAMSPKKILENIVKQCYSPKIKHFWMATPLDGARGKKQV